jgi:hypothetical protein
MEIKAGHSKKAERNVAKRLYIVIGITILAVLLIWGTMLRKGAVPDVPHADLPPLEEQSKVENASDGPAQ